MTQAINILQDITPLSNFRQNASEIIKQMVISHRPQYITVNGKVEAVIQDAAAYQAQLDRIEELETILSMKRGLEDVAKGRVKPLDKVMKEIRAHHENI